MQTIQSPNYLLQQQRVETIEALAFEYINILAILYGVFIEQGTQRIRDYGSMTMLEAENELRLRMYMYRGQRIRKKRQLLADHQENERIMMEELKRATS